MEIRCFGRCLLIPFVAVAVLVGCGAQANYRVSARVVDPPSKADLRISPPVIQSLRSKGEVPSLATDSGRRQAVIDEATAIIESASLSAIVIHMVGLSDSIPRSVKPDILRPLAEQCLLSEDPIIRWAGVYAASAMGDDRLVAETLAKDYTTLLVRPEPRPWWISAWWTDEQSLFNRLNAFGAVEGLRSQMIELLGKHDIQRAKPVLKAIIEDCEKQSRVCPKEEAKRSLEALEQRPPS